MTNYTLLGPWIKRFLMEYLISVKNLSSNTRRSYRDTFCLLLPFTARQARKRPSFREFAERKGEGPDLFRQCKEALADSTLTASGIALGAHE